MMIMKNDSKYRMENERKIVFTKKEDKQKLLPSNNFVKHLKNDDNFTKFCTPIARL